MRERIKGTISEVLNGDARVILVTFCIKRWQDSVASGHFVPVEACRPSEM